MKAISTIILILVIAGCMEQKDSAIYQCLYRTDGMYIVDCRLYQNGEFAREVARVHVVLTQGKDARNFINNLSQQWDANATFDTSGYLGEKSPIKIIK